MKIIAHRGYWIDPIWKNSEQSFHLALQNGFGIETDVRDFNGELVISHDLPDENSLKFGDFMSIVESYETQPLALNIKSDGLVHLLHDWMKCHKDHFVFDMSIPDTLSYVRNGMSYLVRDSEYEDAYSLGGNCLGVWMDNFKSPILQPISLHNKLNNFENVVLVSPELHGYDETEYWTTLRGFMRAFPIFQDRIMLCTDKPQSAEDYFNG